MGIQISQEEAEIKRRGLRDKINNESISIEEREKRKIIRGKQAEIRENEKYITKLERKLLDFRKIDRILLEDKPLEIKSKNLKEEIKEIHKMTEKMIRKNE